MYYYKETGLYKFKVYKRVSANTYKRQRFNITSGKLNILGDCTLIGDIISSVKDFEECEPTFPIY